MNLLVISDLHIDKGDDFGAFQWNETEFIMHVESLRQKYSIDKIVLNGDIFELLKYTMDEIREAYPVLLSYLCDRDFIYIKGNHDIVNDLGKDCFRYTNRAGQIIHIEHGHNADWFNGSRLGRYVSKLGFSLLRKLSHNKKLLDLYFSIVALDEAINHIPKRYNTIRYLTYALKLLKESDVVILAHTHKLESHHTYYLNRKKRYLNCGSCSLGRFQGIILNTETLRYEFIKEEKGNFAARIRFHHETDLIQVSE